MASAEIGRSLCILIIYATEFIYIFSGLIMQGAAQTLIRGDPKPIVTPAPDLFSPLNSFPSFAEGSNYSPSQGIFSQTAREHTDFAAPDYSKSQFLANSQTLRQNDVNPNAQWKTLYEWTKDSAVNNNKSLYPPDFERQKTQKEEMTSTLSPTPLPSFPSYFSRMNQGQAIQSTTSTFRGTPTIRTSNDNPYSYVKHEMDSKKDHSCTPTTLRGLGHKRFFLRTGEMRYRPTTLNGMGALVENKKNCAKSEGQPQNFASREFEGKNLITGMSPKGAPMASRAMSNNKGIMRIPYGLASVAKSGLKSFILGDDISEYMANLRKTENSIPSPVVEIDPTLRGRTGVGATIESPVRLPPLRGTKTYMFALLSAASGCITLPIFAGLMLLGAIRQLRSECVRQVVARAASDAEEERSPSERLAAAPNVIPKFPR